MFKIMKNNRSNQSSNNTTNDDIFLCIFSLILVIFLFFTPFYLIKLLTYSNLFVWIFISIFLTIVVLPYLKVKYNKNIEMFLNLAVIYIPAWPITLITIMISLIGYYVIIYPITYLYSKSLIWFEKNINE